MNKIVLILVILLASGCSFQAPVPKPLPERVQPDVVLEGVNVGGFSRQELEKAVNQIVPQKMAAPQNAFFDEEGNIVREKNGQHVDVATTVTRVMSAAQGTSLRVSLATMVPSITHNRLANAKLIGRFTTPILDSSPGRLKNIQLTAKLISNKILEPGSEFSFNQLTGEPTQGRGFEYATVIVDGRHEKEIGGGMCQVSSTLYNAVLAANLSVTERHAHSQPVTYVPPGRDATTYTDKDFRFRNTMRRPLIIRAFVAGEKTLTVDLWNIDV